MGSCAPVQLDQPSTVYERKSLLVARAGRKFSNCLAAGPPSLIVVSEP